MYSKKDLDKLAYEYENIKTPKNLEKVMIDMFENNGEKNKKNSVMEIAGVSVAAVIVAFTIGLNTSYVFANAMKKVPIVGTMAEFLTFRVYEDSSEKHYVEIDGAKIITDKESPLVNSLNEKYAQNSKKLFDDFMSKIKAGENNTSLFANYTVKADNGTTISIENAIVETKASSTQTLRYDTIDLEENKYITLVGLFKDDEYIKLISDNIKEQIKQQMKDDPNKMYFTDDEGFKEINLEQTFYINDDFKLVIVFDEYEIAPGYMGNVEFVIPTEVIANDLVGTRYIH